jgi:hypothetical protein
MLRERAKPHGLTLRSPRIDEAHRLLRNAPGLARLRLWETNAAAMYQRLLAPLAG